MKKIISIIVMMSILLSLVACSKDTGKTQDPTKSEGLTNTEVSKEENGETEGEENENEVERNRDSLMKFIEEDYNVLQTITVLGMKQPEGSGVSIKESEEEFGFPYVELGSHQSSVVLRGWTPTDLSGYVANGNISLEVKGVNGGEALEVGFEEMINGQSISYTIPVDAAITSDWQTVTIPLSTVVSEVDTEFSGVRQFIMSGEGVQVRNITISSPDKEKQFPEFKVNQLGFKPDSEKYAYVSGYPESLAVYEGDSFEVIDKTTKESVYTGKLTMVIAFDESYSGEQILCADFTELCEEGTYYLKAEGIDDSLTFEIAENVYDELLRNTMRYYYYQRANEEITSEYGEGFGRQDMTPKDFKAPLYYNRDITIDVSGGWYDAGDVGKYVSPGATAVNSLLWTFKLFPECFYDGQNNIPESGNGIPDILDEIKVELDFILKMQDPESGGFYIKVKSKSENDGDGDRTVWVGDGENCITNATADCTAALAFASTIYREYDSEYADTLLTAAEKGWAYIVANPDVYVKTNYSGEDNLSSAFWASACVYYATGNEEAHNYFLENQSQYYRVLSAGANGHNVGNMGIYAYYTYMLCENRDEAVVATITDKYSQWKEAIFKKQELNPWRIAIDKGSFWWGSFNIILGNAQDMIIGDTVLGLDTADSMKLGQDAVNFITGINAVRKCFITGMGEDPIKCTFSNIYYGDSAEGVPVGFMPGGINSHNGGIISKFPLKCYYDSAFDWYTNENAVYWNAVMVFNAAAVVSK